MTLEDKSPVGEWSTIPLAAEILRAANGDERPVYRSTGQSFRQSLEFSNDHKWLAFVEGTYQVNGEISRIRIADVRAGETSR